MFGMIRSSAIVAAFFAVRKIMYYAADPMGEKNCPPAFPAADDPSKATTIEAASPDSLAWSQKGGVVNDASCIDETKVYGVIAVQRVEDVQQALAVAKKQELKLTFPYDDFNLHPYGFPILAL